MTRTSERASEKVEYSLVLEVLDECAAMKPPDGNQTGHHFTKIHTDTHKCAVALLPRGRTPQARRLHINANRAGCMRNLLATVH